MSRSLRHIAAVVVVLVSLAGCQSPPSGTSTNPAPATSAASPKPASPSLSGDDLTQRAIERRAVDAVVWAMPAVNFELMYQAMVRETKGDFNQIVYWSRLLDWRNQTLTPNPDVIYLMPFINTRHAGPMVLEVNSSPGHKGIERATNADVAGKIIAFIETAASHGQTATKGAKG